MAPITVLKETMRAAGDPRLTRWHEALVEKGAHAKELAAVSLAYRHSGRILITSSDTRERRRETRPAAESGRST